MKKVYLSCEAVPPLTSYLTQLGYAIEVVSHEGITYHPVSTHPDIFMCRFGVWENIMIFPGNPDNLSPKYPGNVIYNAVCTGKYFIHNLKLTDSELLAAADKWNTQLEFVDVPQGYTRCCCLPVDDSSFITSDMGIAKALSDAGAEVLIIEKGHISLSGFDYGFIGGCAGHIVTSESKGNEDNSNIPTIVFNGDLSNHPDYNKITAFINERGIDIAYFKDYPLTDIGSIITAPL
ncbi:MAG: hypothetical protein Q4B18_03440 [Bacillota bacterium]|nr:hypothetical protein [Bacillota bacterium]